MLNRYTKGQWSQGQITLAGREKEVFAKTFKVTFLNYNWKDRRDMWCQERWLLYAEETKGKSQEARKHRLSLCF